MTRKESERRYFLVQSTGNRVHHWTRRFEDRTYAEELQRHHYYRHDAWQTGKKDQNFGQVRAGDLVLQYCTLNVARGPGRIRDVWEVTAVEPVPEDDVEDALGQGTLSMDRARELRNPRHVLRLRHIQRFDGGILRSTVLEAVDQGKLSKRMANCGRTGFNICRVEETDYLGLLDLDRVKLGAEVSLYENQLQSYLAAHGNAGAIDPRLAGFNLFTDDEGNSGKEYVTGVVGRIDLLYSDADGNFLVVELKKTDDTDDKAVGQLARYKRWVRRNLAKGKKVLGLIVTHSSSTELRYAIQELPDSSLYEFETKFDFEEVKPA